MKNKNLKKIIIIVALVLLVIVASIYVHIGPKGKGVNGYIMTLINVSMIYCCVVCGICLLLGYGGMLTFTAMSYLGMGAYVVAYLTTKQSFPVIPSILVAVVFTVVFAYLLGLILLRLNGTFFMFADMGVMYVLNNIYAFWEPVTGGANGINGIPKLEVFDFRFDSYYKWFTLLLIVTIIIILITLRIRNTSFGRSLMAVRDDQIAAQTLGVNVYKTKVYAYTLAATFAGFAGALYALHNGTLSAMLFQYNVQVNCITMAVVGGMQSPIGIFFASFLINTMPEFMRFLQSYMRLFCGLLVIVMMLFLPTGLVGLATEAYKKIARLIKDKRASDKGQEVRA